MATAVILPADAGKTKNIFQSKYPKIVKIDNEQKIVRINQTLPFRVKFTTIKIENIKISFIITLILFHT
mgnify:CR=1 FL=1